MLSIQIYHINVSYYDYHSCLTASAATFSGDNSYARIVLDSLLFSFGSQFGVEFRTRDEDGIIMLVKLYSISSSQVDFMTLKLEGGTLRFDTSFGGIGKHPLILILPPPPTVLVLKPSV